MSTVPTTNTTDVRALAAAVRDGELTPGQRERLAALLIPVRVCPACRREGNRR